MGALVQLPEAVIALGKNEPTQFIGDGAKPLICGRNTQVMHIANLCIVASLLPKAPCSQAARPGSTAPWR